MTYAHPFDEFGLASYAELKAAGLTRGEIRAHESGRRWRRVHRQVYACFTGPLPRPARLKAALLHAGAPAVLSHHTAAQEWGFMKPENTGPVHLTVPYTSSAISQPGEVQIHRSRAYRFIRVEDLSLPRTIVVATVVDIAVLEESAAEAQRVMIALAGRAGVPVGQLIHELEVRRPRRHLKALERAAGMFAEGVTSALELEYKIKVESNHGLPVAERQTPFQVDGRLLYEDVTYDHIGVALTVRLDGKEHHSVPGVAFRDRRRDNAAELRSRARLVYGWRDVHRDPCGVAREVVAILRREGWQGQVYPCQHCTGREWLGSS